MQSERINWLLKKGLIALPIILVLVLLARCGSEPDSSSEQTSADKASEPKPEQTDTTKASRDQAQTEERNPESFTAEEIKAAMREHIEDRTQMGNPGVFEITDPRTSQTLELRFQKTHDPVRTMGDGHYFACTNFAEIGDPYKTYDLDFWLQVHDGELVVYEENVHKLPVHEHGEWVQQPRYNFVDDRINLLR